MVFRSTDCKSHLQQYKQFLIAWKANCHQQSISQSLSTMPPHFMEHVNCLSVTFKPKNVSFAESIWPSSWIYFWEHFRKSTVDWLKRIVLSMKPKSFPTEISVTAGQSFMFHCLSLSMSQFVSQVSCEYYRYTFRQKQATSMPQTCTELCVLIVCLQVRICAVVGGVTFFSNKQGFVNL